MKRSSIYLISIVLVISCCLFACKNKPGKDKKLAMPPADAPVPIAIQTLLSQTDKISNNLDDSTRLYALPVIEHYYNSKNFEPLWIRNKRWLPCADSMLAYLDTCQNDGLFANDYRLEVLRTYRYPATKDSLKSRTILHWAKADILFTDAFARVAQDLRQGRLQADSLSWKYKPGKQADFFGKFLNEVNSGISFASIIEQLQPSLRDYRALKKSIPAFVKSMDNKRYTYLQFPAKDSLSFLNRLLLRLEESGVKTGTAASYDSTKLKALLSRFQKTNGLKPTGKISAGFIIFLNNTDQEKFKRIAITLDKYKQLPEQLPAKYIWVNLPSYHLQVWEDDSLVMRSKVIIGKPQTPTPDISSEISNIVIYPTWTVPNSIITKELLPGLKKSADYLARKGLSLYDAKGDLVNAQSVNWARYTKGIPYFVRQSSGDNNALGVIKFNFNNPYAVYLHDTNQRYLFKNKSRSLSHGCVRVQDWKKLAFYIVRNDSIQAALIDSTSKNTLSADSIISWIAQKQKHSVPVKQRLPVYIRYLSCEAVAGNIVFHEDVYNKDKVLREKYFALK